MFDDLVEFRAEAEVDGVRGWFWPKSDHGCWDGPSKEYSPLLDFVLANLPENRRRAVVAAGGACGMYPRLLSRSFLNVFTFEPDALNFYVLNRNCQDENVFKFNCALGDGDLVTLTKTTTPSNLGMHSVTKGGVMPSIRLDDLNLHFLDYLQLDVEGWEEHVLKGAQKTLERHRPVVSLEHARDPSKAILEALGYTEAGVHGFDTVFLP